MGLRGHVSTINVKLRLHSCESRLDMGAKLCMCYHRFRTLSFTTEVSHSTSITKVAQLTLL